MIDRQGRVCPVKRAGSLDNKIRRWVQNPLKILRPYVDKGMTVLDVGCGPGFFSIDMAKMVGRSGRVIASDLQEGMLHKLKNKIQGTELEKRIILHKCEEKKIGVVDPVDFILAFYMIHEIPHQGRFFKEIANILKMDGLMLIVEPPFHVSKKAFNQTIIKAQETGLTASRGPGIFLSKTVILKKG